MPRSRGAVAGAAGAPRDDGEQRMLMGQFKPSYFQMPPAPVSVDMLPAGTPASARSGSLAATEFHAGFRHASICWSVMDSDQDTIQLQTVILACFRKWKEFRGTYLG